MEATREEALREAVYMYCVENGIDPEGVKVEVPTTQGMSEVLVFQLIITTPVEEHHRKELTTLAAKIGQGNIA